MYTDYDPEADIPDSQDEDGSDSDDGADFAGTEHYSNVGYVTRPRKHAIHTNISPAKASFDRKRVFL